MSAAFEFDLPAPRQSGLAAGRARRLSQPLDNNNAAAIKSGKLSMSIFYLQKFIERHERMRRQILGNLESMTYRSAIFAQAIAPDLSILESIGSTQLEIDRASIIFAKHQRLVNEDVMAFKLMNERIAESFLSMMRAQSESISRIAIAMKEIHEIIGAYRFSSPELWKDEKVPDREQDEEDDTKDDIQAPEIPNEIQERLIKVEFLPLITFDAITQNPQLMKKLNPHEFETFVADLLPNLGYHDVILTPHTKDGGKDIIAKRIVNDIPLVFYFECKHYSETRKVGLETMRTLLGSVAASGHKANIGVLVTTSTFSKDARHFILSEVRIDGKDFHDLLKWIDFIKQKDNRLL